MGDPGTGTRAAPAFLPFGESGRRRDGGGHPLAVEAERRFRDPRLPGLGDDQPGWDFAGVTAGPVGSRRDDAATRRVGRGGRVRDGRSGYGNPRGAGVPAIRGEWPTTRWRRPSPRGRGGAPLPGSAAPRTRRRRGRDSSGCHGAAGRFAGAAGPVRGAPGQCTAVAPAGRGEWSGWPIERRPVGRTLGYPRSINALGRPPPPRESDDPSPTRSRPGAPAPDRLRVRRTPLSRVGRPRGGPSPRHSGEAGNHPR